jgi:IMP dehydrogenase
MRKGYTFDDYQLVPQYSEVLSRNNVDLSTYLTNQIKLDIPIVASPMDTVCEWEMASTLMDLGGIGCIHRFMDRDDRVKQMEKTMTEGKTYTNGNRWVMVAVGVGDYELSCGKFFIEHFEGENIILLIDVAHGHHTLVERAIKTFKDHSPNTPVIGGNISTEQAAIDLQNWGVDGLRIGIGGGSLCSTRIQSGHGIPNATAVNDISFVSEVPIMVDGGIRNSGDISKALSMGGSTVMLGSLLSGTEESPASIIETPKGLMKRYRGSASLDNKVSNNQDPRNIEGESTLVPYKGGVKYTIQQLLDGIKSSFSYSGCSTLTEFQHKSEMILVSEASKMEARPHLLYS